MGGVNGRGQWEGSMGGSYQILLAEKHHPPTYKCMESAVVLDVVRMEICCLTQCKVTFSETCYWAIR